MRKFDTALVVGVAIVICGLSMGCKQKLNVKKGEKLIKEKLAEQLELEVKSVKCPKSVEAKKGDSFTCTAILADDTELQINVEQKDDEGNIEWAAESFVMPAKTAGVIEEEAKKNGVADAKVDCGKAVLPMALPGSIDCTATAGGQTSTLEVSYDDKGNPSWKQKE